MKQTTRAAEVMGRLKVAPGEPANLAGRDTAWSGGSEFEELTAKELDATAKGIRSEGTSELSDAQELLWASDRYALLVVFQAIDAAGKDSTIEHVMSGVNPQGVKVVGFRKPSAEELDHDFLWRMNKVLPARGEIGIFNRSHYEEVVALRVHPKWLGKQRLPATAIDEVFWAERYEDINNFERHLDRNGTKIVKFFLHVSKDEQKKRFLARLDNPDKQWKFNAADLDERALWDEYMDAYDRAITATSTPWGPWFVIPADRKHIMQAMVAKILVNTIEDLQLEWPVVTDEARRANAEARKRLEAEV